MQPVAYRAPPVEKKPPPPPIETERISRGMAALEADAEAMTYLTERGFEPKWIKAMCLMLERWGFQPHQKARWIGFPWRIGSKFHGIKWRIVPSDVVTEEKGGKQKPVYPRFRREKGYESIIYNVDALTIQVKGKRLDQMIVASGETDALALLSMGYRSVIATTVGEKPFPDPWVKQLEHLRRVFICYDNDHVGREKARALAQKLGPSRSFIVRLPDEINDANELLVKLGPERGKFLLDDLLKKARRPEIPSIYFAADLADALQESFTVQEQLGGDFTPWRALNDNLASFNGLVIVGAPQNVGKTTFCLNIADHWASQGRPTLFYCLEMSPTELVSKVMMAKYEMNLEQVKHNYAGVFPRFKQDYSDIPLYVGYTSERKPKALIDTLEAAVERYELQILFFDNVHMLGRGNEKRGDISEFSAGMKDLSMKLGIPIVLVAQPRKLDYGQIMTNWDFRETGDLISDADQIFILHRQQIGSTKDTEVMSEEEGDRPLLSPYTLVRISKARFGGGKDIILYMEGDQHYRNPELHRQVKHNYAGVFPRFKQDYSDIPLYVGYTSERKPKALIDTLEAAVERYELQILFFDNVHMLGRGNEKRGDISEFSAGMKDLSMKLGIPIVLVAQPRKLDYGQIMTNWDFRETGDLISDADQIFILHRQQIGSTKDTEVMSEEEGDRPLLSPYTLVRISKARFGGGKDIILYMEGDQHRFRMLRHGEYAEYRGKRGAWKKGRTEDGFEEGPADVAPDWVTE